MTLRTLLAAAAILLAAPAALAQKTPEATLSRFIALANAGELTTPEGQAILTGEAKQMATEAKSNLPAADKVIPIGTNKAAARIVLRGAPGEEADAYFYLEKTAAGWAVSAFRQMAPSSMDMMTLVEAKKRPTLPLEDQIRKRNLELLLSTDSQLRAWFAANREAVGRLVATSFINPSQPRGPSDVGPLPGLLMELGPRSITTTVGRAEILIGTSNGYTVGFLMAGPSGPPTIDPDAHFWVEDLGDGWFLFRKSSAS